MKKNKKVVIVCLFLVVIIGVIPFIYNNYKNRSRERETKIEVKALGYYADEGTVDNVEYSKNFSVELDKLGSKTDEVYRIKNEIVDSTTIEQIKNYFKMKSCKKLSKGGYDNYQSEEKTISNLKTGKELFYTNNQKEESFISEVMPQYNIDNAKVLYRDKINEIIDLFGLKYKCDKSSFKSYISEYIEYEDKDGNEYEKPSKIGFKCDIALDSELECEGIVPSIRFEVNNKGDIVSIFYIEKELKKLDSTYKLKNIDEIIKDIENDNNVLVGNLVEEGADIVLEDVSLKLYSDEGGSAQKYMIPYYNIIAKNGEENVTILMPAIKNSYIHLK